ncbi:hypothetical protein Ahia01_000839500, partial [Argonauta hians]
NYSKMDDFQGTQLPHSGTTPVVTVKLPKLTTTARNNNNNNKHQQQSTSSSASSSPASLAAASVSSSSTTAGNLLTSNLSAIISSLAPHSVYNVTISATTGSSGLGVPTVLTVKTGSPSRNGSRHHHTTTATTTTSSSNNNNNKVATSSHKNKNNSSSSSSSSVTVVGMVTKQAALTTRHTPTTTAAAATLAAEGGGKVVIKPGGIGGGGGTGGSSNGGGGGGSVGDGQSAHADDNSALQDLPVIVAGSLTAGLVLIFLLVLLIYHCLRTKKRRQKEQNYMMFYAYEDIGTLQPEDPSRPHRHHHHHQQTQLTSPEQRKATSYGSKQDVNILKTQEVSSPVDREIPKIDVNGSDQDKNLSPGLVHPTFWPKEIKTSFGSKHIGIQNLGFEEDSSGSITFGPPSPEDSPRLSAEEVYSRVDTKKKNRMRNESAAAIALMKNNAIPHTGPYANDTDCLIRNESEVVYDERTAL